MEWLAQHGVWCLLRHGLLDRNILTASVNQGLLNTSPQLEVRPEKYGRLRFRNYCVQCKDKHTILFKASELKLASSRGHVKTNKDRGIIPIYKEVGRALQSQMPCVWTILRNTAILSTHLRTSVSLKHTFLCQSFVCSLQRYICTADFGTRSPVAL